MPGPSGNGNARSSKKDFMKELNLKTRREFLRATMIGGAVSWTIPSFLSQTFGGLRPFGGSLRVQRFFQQTQRAGNASGQ